MVLAAVEEVVLVDIHLLMRLLLQQIQLAVAAVEAALEFLVALQAQLVVQQLQVELVDLVDQTVETAELTLPVQVETMAAEAVVAMTLLVLQVKVVMALKDT
jgi:hypothetical protein